jgi:hypothetical protein
VLFNIEELFDAIHWHSKNQANSSRNIDCPETERYLLATYPATSAMLTSSFSPTDKMIGSGE